MLKPLLAEKLAARSAADWFDQLIAVGVPCGPINTVDKGIEFAEKLGLEPIVTAGTGNRARPTMRHPVTFSKTPASYPLAPPESTSTASRSAPGWRLRKDDKEYPTSLRTLGFGTSTSPLPV